MAKVFNNWIQMQADIEAKMSIALDNTLERLLQELQLIVDRVVYGWQSPSMSPWGWGEDGGNRTHEFYDSWQRTKPQLMGNLIQGEIYQAVELMTYAISGGGYVHQDREDLANIIETGQGYNFGQAEGVPREFWSEFEQFVMLNLERIWLQECALVGLNLVPSIGATFT